MVDIYIKDTPEENGLSMSRNEIEQIKAGLVLLYILLKWSTQQNISFTIILQLALANIYRLSKASYS